MSTNETPAGDTGFRDLRAAEPSGRPGPAIVTGSESGIGRASAVELARRGHDVGVTWFRDEAAGRATAEEVRALGRRAELRHLDLRDLPGAADVVDDLADALGGVEVLVNDAGTGTSTPLLELGFEDWREVLSVDLDGAFLCLQRAARRMVAAGRGGRIVNITSVHEHQPRVGAAPYCAAKGGLGLLTRTAAIELAEHGITVNAVAPGEIATPMTGQEDTDPHTEHRPGVPLGRPGDAREIAAVVGFLCSPQASYVTGASYAVDGGMLQMGPMAGSHLTEEAWRRP
ncbi:SDR family oxidoreductase [Kineococcus sp. T13]|uniref:SDR family oxidoreductase n=1 Tax=Kineococcus vitellinus TaxID=2696565 RepID=UPI001411C25A|nr:SDR family oxidoreductase [Kineococcus vitellinus]NAZ74357.1 SDR family oxidoreductase [Kineococcus vitellinus]